ncbi:MAG: thiol reductant ABC exporter subunit CydC, partial [Streptosporangiaceae bacterium]
LQAFGASGQALDRAERANRELGRIGRRSAAASGLGTGLSALVAGLTLWAALVLGVAATGAGALGRVPLAVLALTAMAAFEAVNLLPAAAVQLSQARASGQRIGEVLDAPEPVAEPADPLPLPAGPVTVTLRGARLRYTPDGPLAVDGVSLDLPPGRRVALVGPNGAGKSTIASVLLRFRELDSGSATLNGVDLAAFAGDDVRTVIGGCPQDPYLFDASIEENLRVADPVAGGEALRAVLRQVGLGGWVDQLPDGLATRVGPDGAQVSGGQRQRIALARALLADPAVLILDEPTAHLDAESRRKVMADVLAVTRGRCTLLITHDLDGLEQVDEIVVLDRGRVAERGTHADLLAADGRYRRLWLARSAGRPEQPPPGPGQAGLAAAAAGAD